MSLFVIPIEGDEFEVDAFPSRAVQDLINQEIQP